MRLSARLAAPIAVSILALALSSVTALAGKVVKFGGGQAAGTIVIVNKDRRLYYVLGKGKAVSYPVAIGRTAQVWTGKTRISRKEKNPSWLNPDDPAAEVVPGGPDNPLGERAMYLGATLYRIHGTPAAWSIGQAVSNGCIRMYNKDVKDLYNRARVGTTVVVTNSLASAHKVPAKPKPVNPGLYAKEKAKKKLEIAIKNQQMQDGYVSFKPSKKKKKRKQTVADLVF
ncbi:MAG: L,D-transpeptidase [Hyphomicrobiaceae bacterium]